MINPKPPIVKRKLEAKPSIMYCPFTRYGINATCKNYIGLYIENVNCKKEKILLTYRSCMTMFVCRGSYTGWLNDHIVYDSCDTFVKVRILYEK